LSSLALQHQFLSPPDKSCSSKGPIFKASSLRINKFAVAEKYFQSALSNLRDTGDNVQISSVMNKLSKIYLETDLIKAGYNLNQTEQYKPFVYPFQKYQAILNYRQGRILQAVSGLQELKLKAGDFWQAEDQLLLEQYQQSLNSNENT